MDHRWKSEKERIMQFLEMKFEKISFILHWRFEKESKSWKPEKILRVEFEMENMILRNGSGKQNKIIND